MASLAEDPASVQQARARARRRLIGAVVLLAVGVIVFPLLFETKPRALPSDIPIHVSRKDSGMVLTAPGPASRPPLPADAGNEGGGAAAEPQRPVTVMAAASEPPETARMDGGPTLMPKPEPPRPEPPKPEPKADAKPDAPKDGASAPAKAGRYIVQVGAFTDALAVREARQKVEKLGLKTYTQEVDTPTGRRTRVRVGPFDSKAEADEASAKLKAAGLPVYLLLL